MFNTEEVMNNKALKCQMTNVAFKNIYGVKLIQPCPCYLNGQKLLELIFTF